MKIVSKCLLIISIVSFISCSDSNIKIATKENTDVVELPDGSVAYLNSNSSIEYKKSFKKREVKQDGEVFFEVTKEGTPFMVKTKIGNIKVLGTEFNVKSNNDDIEVEVEEGTVELKINTLISEVKKGQKAFFSKDKNEIVIGQAEFNYKKWMNKIDRQLKKAGNEIHKNLDKMDIDTKKVGKEIEGTINKIKN